MKKRIIYIFVSLLSMLILFHVAPNVQAANNSKVDVNGDGEISIADVNVVIDFILSNKKEGDANNDGEVNIADVNYVIQYVLDNQMTQWEDNSRAIEQIQNLVANGTEIVDVRNATNGIEVVMSNGSIFTISNLTCATVWTVGSDGYWHKDGIKSDYYAISNDGAHSTYYVPNSSTGCWDIYNSDGTIKERTSIPWKDTAEGITVVMDRAKLKLYNVRITSGYVDYTLAINNRPQLTSLIFQPELYVDGIPAFRVALFGYSPYQMTRMDNGQNGSSMGIEEFSGFGSQTYKARKTYIQYHVNPANANVEDLKNLRFVIKANNKRNGSAHNARASSDFNAEAHFMNYSNGTLTVEVVVTGAPATEEYISVVALQATRTDGVTVTSDYAAVEAISMNDIHIADKARFNASRQEYHYRTVLHSADNSCPCIGIPEYPVTYMQDSDGETCDLQLRWNGQLNIWNYVMAHFYSDYCFACDIEREFGFTWKLELLKNFYCGSNLTDQSEYVDFDPETGILKVKEKYGTSAIDRTPVIRIRIMDGDKTVKLAYIKVKIVNANYSENSIVPL